VHATIFSRAVEIQKELHVKQTALETLSSMHEVADGRPETVTLFNTAVTEQKGRVDALRTNWMVDLKVRRAQLNELLEPGYRSIMPAKDSTPTLQSPVQKTPPDRRTWIRTCSPYGSSSGRNLRRKGSQPLLLQVRRWREPGAR